MEENKITHYTGHFKYGIDDLKNPDPYFQGDGQWPLFSSVFEDVTEEDYKRNPKEYEDKVTKWNDDHIKELKDKGLYLTPYQIEVDMIHNPLYDDAKIENHPLESHKIIFMDFGKENNSHQVNHISEVKSGDGSYHEEIGKFPIIPDQYKVGFDPYKGEGESKISIYKEIGGVITKVSSIKIKQRTKVTLKENQNEQTKI